MFLQNLRARLGARLSGDSEAGFTLIELLVVMLILGILAAIALPAFFNQKEKAGDAKAKETLHSAQVAMETCGTEHNAEYNPSCDLTALEAIEPTLKGQALTVTTSTTNKKEYALQMTGSSGWFKIERLQNGELKYPCEKPGEGGCSKGAGGLGEWKNG